MSAANPFSRCRPRSRAGDSRLVQPGKSTARRSTSPTKPANIEDRMAAGKLRQRLVTLIEVERIHLDPDLTFAACPLFFAWPISGAGRRGGGQRAAISLALRVDASATLVVGGARLGGRNRAEMV